MRTVYITIFDGKSLDGWLDTVGDKVPSRWIIEDGCPELLEPVPAKDRPVRAVT